MMLPETIHAIIAEALPCEHLQVTGDGQHFAALIVSADFAGKSRVQRQQQVNQVLRAHFDSGELHALSMTTRTPEEWSALNG
ncbi:MAG: BolA/IbaG family iron-sulfur metabolism protein [Candidatus Accumulibacter sp.]|uniref:BolA family protein n=1 Tax=Accumulibacter sp. TaxID=2053492 RepID=UPI002878F057|nr:BolA/IbaG family iron-sulfur metabolism protein [Accumulibacter sp.]MDS4016247.1 BolA/IbaG family iron-sulfur metabolism protein [Accumulibacter sp.]